MQSKLILSVHILRLTTGLLSAVGSLMMTVQDSTISLTWTAPFTLDITGVDPDITYCVGVVNSTSSSTLHLECGITETEYEYPIPSDSACHDHMVTVTPVNHAGNGTSSTYYLQGIKLQIVAMTCMYAPYVDITILVGHASFMIVIISVPTSVHVLTVPEVIAVVRHMLADSISYSLTMVIVCMQSRSALLTLYSLTQCVVVN